MVEILREASQFQVAQTAHQTAVHQMLFRVRERDTGMTVHGAPDRMEFRIAQDKLCDAESAV